MTFEESIKIIVELLKDKGTLIDAKDYDGLIVKKLVSSNTLDDGRTTNQTHIAITGAQMDIFPYLCADGYFCKDGKIEGIDLKKYFVISVPISIFRSNCIYISSNQDAIDFKEEKKKTWTCIVRSKRESQADQLQVSMLNMDGKDFVSFRKMLKTNSYFILLKLKKSMEYHAFGYLEEEDNLNSLNNLFLKLDTSTIVDQSLFGVSGTRTKSSHQLGGYNKIYYGAPGCGKSKFISNELTRVGTDKKNIIRVTFHPEYANCDFIGQILPTVETKVDKATGEKKDIVKYIFNPGPFTLALEKAMNTEVPVYLIVEEINRGNAAAIFGDMFQLLDREKPYRSDGTDNPLYGQSEYPVCNPNMQKYLMDKVEDEYSLKMLEDGVFIPSNLTILATMNSSDQNVFTLDTAFKRRWNFDMISNDIKKDEDHKFKHWYVPGTSVTWETFLDKVNDKILDQKIHSQTNEDKRLGKYFVTRECLTETPVSIKDAEDAGNAFAYKILEYIWNDVCKIGREDWFDTSKYKTLEDLIAEFMNPTNVNPLAIFQNITF